MALTDKLTAIANAIRAKTGGTDTMTLDEMPSEIASISGGGAGGNYNIESVDDGNGGQILNITDAQGGTEITDGIVVKERDAKGYAEIVEHYGERVFPYQFGTTGNFGFPKLTTINMKKAISTIHDYGLSSSTLTTITPINWGDSIITIGQYAFRFVKIRTLNFPNATTIGTSTFANVETEELYLPKITRITLSAFYSAKNLTVLQIGSVGYGITQNAQQNSFANVTQSGLTITMFTNGSNADALLSSVRTSATAATIIIKASEATTYNGVSYAAGETMITSEVA